jgi:hypothetical protein
MPGVLTLAGMGLQIPAGGLVLSVGDDGSPHMAVQQIRLRFDLWPTWLEIGSIHAEHARLAGAKLEPGMGDAEKSTLLGEELRSGLAAITAFAFAFDGFYDTLRHELGTHPHNAVWRRKRTARDAQVVETLRYHLKLGPQFSAQLREFIRQLFGFRSRGVHPSSEYVQVTYRPEIDSGVHPHLLNLARCRSDHELATHIAPNSVGSWGCLNMQIRRSRAPSGPYAKANLRKLRILEPHSTARPPGPHEACRSRAVHSGSTRTESYPILRTIETITETAGSD